MRLSIPTEPIGSIPRTPALIEAAAAKGPDDPSLELLYESAIKDTVERFEATGSPVITDGEQRKYHNFWTYCVHGLKNTAPDGFTIPFAAGHTRRMPRLTEGPLRYKRYADSYLEAAQRYAHVPVKQAVISPSALSLMYPPAEVRDRVLEAAEYIPVEQLGTTDDCGFSPFCDDLSTTRDTTFAKIKARVDGTALAAEKLGGR